MDFVAVSTWATVAAAAGQIVGAGAVVITILYLVRQVRLNTQAIRVASYQGDITNTISLTGAVFLHAEFAEFFFRAQRDPSTLSPVETTRWHCFMLSVFRHYEGLLLQHREGAIDADLRRGYDGALVNWLRGPGWSEWFEKNATSFGRALQDLVLSHIQRLRAERAATQPPAVEQTVNIPA
ncbi:MAG TPA: hypothetical protein VD965_09220 [Burkholderiales bacterium]|nr:hypothetical protein [Burkholderiales bacterium]